MRQPIKPAAAAGAPPEPPVHVAVVWTDLGDPDMLRHIDLPCGTDPAASTWTVNRALATCATCLEADPGPRVTYRPKWTPFAHARWRRARPRRAA